ncbi:hypothetical protein SASPL_121814 [Salvia splendens]|uniref:Triacylglycerol lipase n=1 Tax=Salvia splendens TaxID=180675 RepID=A0A8X8ZWF6_SALSN|nr:hypothetical protein SASPL_121814 [Salvia splendens]
MTSIPRDLPLLLSYGGKDPLSDVKDVHMLIEALSNHDRDKLVVHYVEKLKQLVTGRGTKISRELESSNNEDGICQLIVKTKGYSCEEHKDATTWLALSPDESLGFILADNRMYGWATCEARTTAEYWDWSWDELVAYDLPAMFDYVHTQTGQKLHYVGHSLGTLMAFGAFSRHEVLSMVRSAALLSPIAYMGQMPSPLARAAADIFTAEVSDLLVGSQKNSLREGEGPVSKLVADICSHIDCSNFENIITVIRKGTIAMYDYGSDGDNNKHYGQATPPDYNITSIPNDLPLFLSYGGKDLLSDAHWGAVGS